MFTLIRLKFKAFQFFYPLALVFLFCSTSSILPIFINPLSAEEDQRSPIGASERSEEEKKHAVREKFERSRALFDRGQYEESIALLKELLALDRNNHDAMVLLGWSYYRKGDFRSAEGRFARSYKTFPRSTDVMNGLGYCKYQLKKYAESEKLFLQVLDALPDDYDALKGLGIVKRIIGDQQEAKKLFDRALSMNPDDAELKALSDQMAFLAGSEEDRRIREPLSSNIPIRISSRSGKDYFSVINDGKWQDIFIKGVNIGVALPGKFPAEFPTDKKLYLEWLCLISEMNANAVRVYTLLPPAFYEALKEHNEKNDVGKLWLIQGVWVELPPDNDFYNLQFMNDFKADIARVIDAIHGNIEIACRLGHACGRYSNDVSSHLLAVILGREWEPFSVVKFNQKYPDVTQYAGEYFAIEGGNPMECWIAEICNFAAMYESDLYRMQHPLAFSNWPTLDPLLHPSETSKTEENEIKKKLGLKVDPVKGDQYDDDAVSVDSTRIVPTEKMKAGFFASYHIYPYHPDFLNNDPAYAKARDGEGPNNYFGYLQDLKRYHGSQAILVAEFGVPASKGISHFQRQGMNHGGHTEIEQGNICRRLMKNIVDAGCAGGIVFSWIDEWFKKNWLTVDFVIPLERNLLWYNAIDAEENFGLLAMKPGKDCWKIIIDGKPQDWDRIPPLYKDDDTIKDDDGQTKPSMRSDATAQGSLEKERSISVRRKSDDGFDAARDLRRFSVTSDEGYLYLRLDVASLDCNRDGKVDWDKSNYLIGIDTYRSDLGDFRFPSPADVFTPGGMEFLIELKGEKGSKILVDEPYSTFIHTAEGWGPYRSLPNREGRFIEIKAETNRERYGRDGTRYDGISYSKSPLRFGSMERGSKEYDTLADWYLNREENFIEIRISWALLNVTDPSSRRVLHQEKCHLAPLDTVKTDGFYFYIASVDPVKEKDAASDSFPSTYDIARKGLRAAPLYSWDEWEAPTYHEYLKDSYFLLRDDFDTIKTYIKK